jgi:hypothetical protein
VGVTSNNFSMKRCTTDRVLPLAILFVLINHVNIRLLHAKVPLPTQSALTEKWRSIAAETVGPSRGSRRRY